MLLMIESGIRGEIATISHRHAKANNEYMEAEFDSNGIQIHLVFRCKRPLLLGDIETTSNVWI